MNNFDENEFVGSIGFLLPFRRIPVCLSVCLSVAEIDGIYPGRLNENRDDEFRARYGTRNSPLARAVIDLCGRRNCKHTATYFHSLVFSVVVRAQRSSYVPRKYEKSIIGPFNEGLDPSVVPQNCVRKSYRSRKLRLRAGELASVRTFHDSLERKRNIIIVFIILALPSEARPSSTSEKQKSFMAGGVATSFTWLSNVTRI